MHLTFLFIVYKFIYMQNQHGLIAYWTEIFLRMSNNYKKPQNMLHTN